MAICAFDARTLASETCIEDLMMHARKINYDAIGLTETRRHRQLHALFDCGEERRRRCVCSRQHALGYEHRFVGKLNNWNRKFAIKMRLNPTLTIFFAYAPITGYEEEELEAFYMGPERFYREDHFL
nr:unnamed protein product [Haemonchus contortus]